MARRWGDETETRSAWSTVPQPDVKIRESGGQMGLTSHTANLERGTPREGVERAPKAAQNLRHEQRRNRFQLQ
jgi:hypothetical protein